MEWLYKFPTLKQETLILIRRKLDQSYDSFITLYSDFFETLFAPLLKFLIFTEIVFLNTPWWIILFLFTLIPYLLTRNWKLSLSIFCTFIVLGMLNLWDDTMRTMVLIMIATIITIIIGLPIGILMALFPKFRMAMNPILDIMQTMPPFVYLIPIVMLLGVGRVPGLITVVVYAIPPIIRLTDLGIRMVPQSTSEASNAFGASPMQKLIKVQIPLALPSIMMGINQTIMMALSMVVLASMIGVAGLGQSVLRAIAVQSFSSGLLNGIAIVAIAIIFDRISQLYSKKKSV